MKVQIGLTSRPFTSESRRSDPEPRVRDPNGVPGKRWRGPDFDLNVLKDRVNEKKKRKKRFQQYLDKWKPDVSRIRGPFVLNIRFLLHHPFPLERSRLPHSSFLPWGEWVVLGRRKEVKLWVHGSRMWYGP